MGTDRQTDMTKLVVAFRNFCESPLKKTAIEELITSNKHYKPTVHKRPYSTHLYYVLGATC